MADQFDDNAKRYRKRELVGTRTRQGKGEISEFIEGRPNVTPLQELIYDLRAVVIIAIIRSIQIYEIVEIHIGQEIYA